VTLQSLALANSLTKKNTGEAETSNLQKSPQNNNHQNNEISGSVIGGPIFSPLFRLLHRLPTLWTKIALNKQFLSNADRSLEPQRLEQREWKMPTIGQEKN